MKNFLPLIVAMAFIALLIGYSAMPSTTTTEFYLLGISDTGEGVLVPFKLEFAPGTGKVLVDASDASYRKDTAESLRQARDAAEKALGLPLKNADLLLELDVEGADVGGDSGGAAFAVAIIASYHGVQPDCGGAISASLEDGGLAPVGGITEKIAAAADAGKKFFVVAKAQEINGENSLKQRIQIIRVDSLAEAARLFLGG